MKSTIDPDLRDFLNSRCRHGYSARKRCSRCQSALRNASVERPRAQKRRSVYEDRV